MEFPKEKLNRCKKKVIPWHVQKRYMENLSQLSLNQTIATAFYKRKINTLQKNNKHLALAVQRSRHLVIEKENLLIDNGKILDVMNFLKLQLMDMAKYMKQATACVDETLSMLNSCVADNLSKKFLNNLNYRNYFKDKLQEINIEPIKEVVELESDISNKSTKTKKGKISRVDGCVSSPNKKCRLGMTGGKCKSNSKKSLKPAKQIGDSNVLTCRNSTEINCKKCTSKINIESQSKRKLSKSNSIKANSAVKSTSTLKLAGANSNNFVKAKNKQKCINKKSKTVIDILTDTAEAFTAFKTEGFNSLQSNEFTSTSKTGCEVINKQKTSCSTLNSDSTVESNHQGTDCSQNTSVPSYLANISSLLGDVTTVNNKLSVSPSEKNEDFTFGQTSAVVKMQRIEERGNCSEEKNNKCIKSNNSKKEKTCNSSNSKVKNRIQFYFDEDSIEKVDEKKIVSKSKKIKCKKYKGQQTVPNMNKNISSKCTVLNSNLKLPDNVSKLGKNSFLVTAEVHSPPVGIYEHKSKSKMCVAEKMEPRVVLTDIFESNRGLLSEMIHSSSQRNGYCRNIAIHSTEIPLVAVNDLKSTYLDVENNSENRCLPEDREILKKRDHRHRAKIVSYKEPSLNVKMRRLI